MPAAPVTLHPSMTAEQIARWCAEHKMVVTIEGIPTGDLGHIQPVITARREVADFAIPKFLRRQAD